MPETLQSGEPSTLHPAADHPTLHRHPDPIGIAFVVVSAVCFGTMAILARVAYASGADLTTLLALRFGLAALVMLALLAVHRIALPRGAALAGCIALGAIGYASQAFVFFSALKLAPAGLVALLLYLHPAIVAVLAALILRERLTVGKTAALALALLGTVMTLGPLAEDYGSARSAGIALAFAAAAIYAVYIVGASRLSQRVDALAMSAVVIASAAVVYGIAMLVNAPRWPRGVVGWAAVILIALVCTATAISLYFAGLGRVGPTRAATLSTIEPVCTVALAATLLHEPIGPLQAAGGALILAAVVVLARGRASGP